MSSNHYYTVYGTVRRADGTPLPWASVHLRSPDGTTPAYDYHGEVDDSGDYTIDVDSSRLNNIYEGDIYTPRNLLFEVRSARGKTLKMLTRYTDSNDICWGLNLDFVLEEDDLIDDDCCCPDQHYSVRGHVSGDEGEAIVDHEVVVYQQHFRSKSRLASTETDGYGNYYLPYLPNSSCSGRGPDVDIYVAVLDDDGSGTEDARSELICNPPRHLVVNLGVGGDGVDGRSEYERVRAGLMPHLAGVLPEALRVEDVSSSDAVHLASRSGLAPHLVQTFLSAVTGANTWQDVGGSDVRVSAPAIYAWIRLAEQRPLEALALEPLVTLTRRLELGEARALVPEFLKLSGGQLPSDNRTVPVAENVAWYFKRVMGWPTLLDTEQLVYKLLSRGGLASDQSMIDFLEFQQEHPEDVSTFWSAYDASPASSGVDVERLQTTLFLADITQQNLDLVDHILATPGRAEAFAGHTFDDWKAEFISNPAIAAPKGYPGEDPAEQLDNYALALSHGFEHAYPTRAVIEGLVRVAAQRLADFGIDWKVAGFRPTEMLAFVTGASLPRFELRTTVVDDYAPIPAGDWANVRDGLKVVQRLHGLVAGFDTAEQIAALYDEGIQSSQDIVKLTQASFVAKAADKLGSSEAAMAVFYRAQVVNSTVTELMLRANAGLHPAMVGIGGPRIKDPDASGQDQANLETLFGSLDYCSCRHCRSMLSPAAYLADLLQFIGEDGEKALGAKPDGGTRTHRRPDITEINLNCDNAFTPLPHIDLVNELLEERVLWANDELDFSSATWDERQTTLTAEQLRAHPEHLEVEAYQALRTITPQSQPGQPYLAALRPWVLPYDLFLEEARRYLKQLGVEREQLISVFRRDSGTTQAIVREQLSLAKPVADLLVDTTEPGDGVKRDLPATMAWLGDAGRSFRADLNELRGVRDFLEATELDLDEALELFSTLWPGRLDGNRDPLQLLFNNDNGCTLEVATFDFPQTDDPGDESEPESFWLQRLGRVHRFLRIYRMCGWTINELDEVVRALNQWDGIVEIRPAFLEHLATLQALHARFPEIPLMDKIMWWGDLEARLGKRRLKDGIELGYATRLEELVKAAADGQERDFLARFEVFEDPFDHNILHLGGSIFPEGIDEAALSFLATAFEQSVTQLRAQLKCMIDGNLVTHLIPSAGADPQVELTIRNLSLIYGRITLARALKRTPVELMRLEGLTGQILSNDSSGVPNHTGAVAGLVAASDFVGAMGVSLDELDYLLNADLEDTAEFVLQGGRLLRALVELFAAKQAALAPLASVLADLSARQLPVDHLRDLLNGLAGNEIMLTETMQNAGVDLAAQIDEIARIMVEATALGTQQAVDRALFDSLVPNTVLGSGRDDPSSISSVYDEYIDTPDPLEQRIEKLIEAMLTYRRRQATQALTIDWLAARLGLDPELGEFVARTFVARDFVLAVWKHADGLDAVTAEQFSQWLAVDDVGLLEDAIMAVGVGLPEVFDVFAGDCAEMQRVALIIKATSARLETVQWLLEPEGTGTKASTLGVVQLETLTGGGLTSFAELEKLHALIVGAETFAVLISDWHEILDEALGLAPASPALPIAVRVAEVLQLDQADIEELIGPDVLNLLREDVLGIKALVDVKRALLMRTSTGADFKSLKSWAGSNSSPDVSSEEAAAIKLHARAQYSDDAWPKVVEPIRDELREQQRDALEAYVEAYYEYPQEYELYSWMLIDPDFNACGISSRIVAATSSLQQLVQRRLLGLEAGENVALSGEDTAQQWEWRSRYRVWEANRKVFLYPENWLRPEWRDDKTPLFEKFERDVLASDIDDAGLEKAFVNYLEGLDSIARLEVNGMYDERENTEGRADFERSLHVFARGRGRSAKNYYRRRIGRHANFRWSPWQELPFEVEGKDVFPVVYNRRLMLIWPKFEIEPDPPGQTREGEPEQRESHYKVRLGYVERHHGEWGEVKETEGYILALAQWCSDKFKSNSGDFGRNASKVARDVGESPDLWARPKSANHIYLEQDDGGEDDGDKLIVHLRFRRANSEECREHCGTSPDNTACFAAASHYFDAGAFVFGSCDANVDIRNVHAPAARGPSRSENHRVHQQSFRVSDGLLQLPGHNMRLWQYPEAKPFEWVYSRQDRLWRSGYAMYQDNSHSLLLHSSARREWYWVPGVPGDLPGPSWVPTLNGALTGSSEGYLPTRIQTSRKADLPDDDITVYPWWWHYYWIVENWFTTFYHPYTCLMLSQVERFGVEGLFRPESTGTSEETLGLIRQHTSSEIIDSVSPIEAPFSSSYGLDRLFPVENYDFGNGPYSVYNWELFYHSVVLIADQLHQSQRFSEARKWLHYIFDPTQTDIGEEQVDFWRIKPFKNQSASLAKLLETINKDDIQDGDNELGQSQVEFSVKNPFNPHGIARLRKTPYMVAVVLLYIENLIAWGDQLFRQESIEAVAEATQLYAIAAQLLGERPAQLPEFEVIDQSFSGLGTLGALSNTLVDVESRLLSGPRELKLDHRIDVEPQLGKVVTYPDESSEVVGGALTPVLTTVDTQGLHRRPGPRPVELYTIPVGNDGRQVLYFCAPHNERLVEFWAQLDDRLFKVRNCLNIAGQPRTIRLFEPPIDPGALIDAIAGGASLSDALGDLNAPNPNYRFSHYLNLAKQIAGDVRDLGASLLSALERRDAEKLSQLHSSHEIRLLEEVEKVIEAQIEESEQAIEVLETSRKVTEQRQNFYAERKQNGRTSREDIHTDLILAGGIVQGISTAISSASGIARIAPDITVGVTGAIGSPTATLRWGGSNLSGLMSGIATAIQGVAGGFSTGSRLAGIESGYIRREDEWAHMAAQAKIDLDRIDLEISAAELRVEVSKRELERHKVQVNNAEEMQAFVTGKYSNDQLFRWLSNQLSRVFFRSYELAFDVAKRAQRCFELELGAERTNYIRYGAWDSRRQGLLSGERLVQGLRELEKAYYDANRREYELTKRVSLMHLDPGAVVDLRESGETMFSLPEVIFDLDHPSHYMRRIKTVRLSIPCVGGEFENVNAQLTLLGSAVRTRAKVEPEFLVSDLIGGTRTIATSTGSEDAGVFPADHNDARYLPFEYKGVVSSWKLGLPTTHRSFDYSRIKDAVLTIEYTSREGGAGFAAQVQTAIKDDKLACPWGVGVEDDMGNCTTGRVWPATPELMMRGFSVKAHFPAAWQNLRDQVRAAFETDTQVDYALELRLPVSARALGLTGEVNEDVKLFFAASYQTRPSRPNGLRVAFDIPDPSDLSSVATVDLVPHGGTETKTMSGPTDATQAIAAKIDPGPAGWRVTVLDDSSQSTKAALEQLEDLLVVVLYNPKNA